MSRGLGDRAHPAYFWLGASTVTVGVGLHLPMFVEAQRMNFHLAGMPVDWRMLLGMDPSECPLFVLDPIAARQFAERGPFESKARLADWVYETAQHVFGRDSIHVVVVGGETNGYWRMFGANLEKTVLIDAWR